MVGITRSKVFFLINWILLQIILLYPFVLGVAYGTLILTYSLAMIQPVALKNSPRGVIETDGIPDSYGLHLHFCW